MKYFNLILVLLLTVSIFSCSDEEDTPVAYNLAKNTGELQIIEIDSPSKDTFYHDGLPFGKLSKYSNGTSPYLYVGSDKGVCARSILQYDLVQTLKESLIITEVKDATITLYKSGETHEGEIRIRAHKMLSDWNETYATWKYSSTDTLWEQAGGCYEEQPFDIIDYFPTPGDTTLDTLRINLPGSIAKEWLNAYVDTVNYQNYGLILLADDAETMKRFNSRNYSSPDPADPPYRPELIKVHFNYEKNGEYFTDGYAEFEMSLSRKTGKDTYIANAPNFEATGHEEHLQVGNGYFVRSLMGFEIPSTIPVESTVNLAEITVNLLPEEEQNFDDLVLQIYRLTEDWEENEQSLEEMDFYTSAYYISEVAIEDSTAIIRVTNLIQHWVNYPEENYGLLFRSGSEILNFSSLKFYSSEAEESLRPKLSITYTKPADYYW